MGSARVVASPLRIIVNLPPVGSEGGGGGMVLELPWLGIGLS